MPLLDNFRPRKRMIFARLGPFLGAAFLIVAFILASNLQAAYSARQMVLGEADVAYGSLASAYEELSQSNLEAASVYFAEASENFARLSSILNSISTTIRPLKAETLTTALSIARVGQSVSAAGDYLSSGLLTLLSTAARMSEVEVLSEANLSSASQLDIIPSLRKAQADFDWADDLILQARTNWDQANKQVLGRVVGEDAELVEERLFALSLMAKTLKNLNSLFLEMSTRDYHQNFLFLFQNNAEARPGGGFLGSYGLLKMTAGSPQSLLIESIYELDGKLTEKILPPEPLRYVAGDMWAMRDANWWPDYKVSAENIGRFYEMESGQTADVIFALTPDVFERIIHIVGPVELPKYNIVVYPANFYDVVQEQTSKLYDREENKPKKFMAELAGEILRKLPELGNEQKLMVIGSLMENIYEKNIMLYSRHADIQDKIESMGFSGRMTDVSKFPKVDSLLITHANVGGGKSDRYISTTADLRVGYSTSGKIAHKLTITRVNESPHNLEYSANINYLRVYVPMGAKLSKGSQDFDTFEELARTVFATTIRTEAGQKSQVTIEYELPVSYYAAHSYVLILEKNPGQRLDALTVNVTLPEGSEIIHNIGVGERFKNTFYTKITPLNSTKVLGIIFK